MVPESGPPPSSSPLVRPFRPADTILPPRLLVSVRDAAEAAFAAEGGADIVDAKDPEDGPLGALPVATVAAVAAAVAGRAAVSAVACAGERGLAASVAATAAAGVDYVKVAVGPDLLADTPALVRIASAAPGRLVAVLFAEDVAVHGLAPVALSGLAAAGFAGAMLDTSGKAGRRLPDILDGAALRGFTAACRAAGLVSGLAGSLRIGDVAALAAHAPAYLGFRGGLCRGGDRRRALDPARLAEAVSVMAALRRRDAA